MTAIGGPLLTPITIQEKNFGAWDIRHVYRVWRHRPYPKIKTVFLSKLSTIHTIKPQLHTLLKPASKPFYLSRF